VRRTTTVEPGSVIRRAPEPSDVEGEYADPDVPGFIFVSTGVPDEFVIKGSDIRVVWSAKDRRWEDPSGLVVTFQDLTPVPTAGPTPLLELPSILPLPPVRTLPPRNSKEWQHYSLTMDDFKRLGLYDQMLKIAEMANEFPVTPFELELRSNPRERPARFYRYHKFPLDPTAQQLVFGGGLNKTEITPDWHRDPSKTLKALLKTRYDLMRQLRSNVDREKRAIKAMQKFQANAMTTPFIATTTDGDYARSLYREYPPTEGQRAVVLVIEGPELNAFDFEFEFAKMAEQGGGRAEWNWRTSEDRAKDANQAEFGLPDLFIPMRGVSPLGFRIVDVIELNVPTAKQALELSLDQRMQVIRARNLPKNPSPEKGESEERGGPTPSGEQQ
jgi:hypothetical protein